MAKKGTRPIFTRDLSWLSFNARVMQEAEDPSVSLLDRIRFLGIFSNNLDEFFRVRVASLSRMARLGKAAKVHLEDSPEKVLRQIQETVMEQQNAFDHTFHSIMEELERQGIFLKNEKQLNPAQSAFIARYFDEEVRTRIVPLMLESIPQAPLLRDKSMYLACVLGAQNNSMLQRYSLIEVPTRALPRFVELPAADGQRHLILLEDIIRHSLPQLFGPFGFDRFLSYTIKLTRDAEMDIDLDLNVDAIEALEKGIKSRKRGRATRFVYDRTIDAGLLDYLVKRLSLTGRDNLIPGGRIHNFKDFMNFPSAVFAQPKTQRDSFVHPLLRQPVRIMSVLDTRDVLLHLPYHSFDSVIDLLREAAIDPFVNSIKITCYRLAEDSKIVNALINAVRNGKAVTVMLELRARFDEEANLYWKTRLEDEGARVLIGVPGMKVHAKLCVIKKREFNRIKEYGFISTGNFNESTARFYGDHCLLTSNRKILADADRVFRFLEGSQHKEEQLQRTQTLVAAPVQMRHFFNRLIDQEIKAFKKGKPAGIRLKLNNLIDPALIAKLYNAAAAGVSISMVVRSICGVMPEQKGFRQPIRAISIVDEYLEHSRILCFHHHGERRVYISSADWMVRNLDHRVEVACPILDPALQQELMDVLELQLRDNVKARILDDKQQNEYVQQLPGEPVVRSQEAIYDYLAARAYDGKSHLDAEEAALLSSAVAYV